MGKALGVYRQVLANSDQPTDLLIPNMVRNAPARTGAVRREV
jgi:hypothetical protein